jgi:hypothetical protein
MQNPGGGIQGGENGAAEADSAASPDHAPSAHLPGAEERSRSRADGFVHGGRPGQPSKRVISDTVAVIDFCIVALMSIVAEWAYLAAFLVAN